MKLYSRIIFLIILLGFAGCAGGPGNRNVPPAVTPAHVEGYVFCADGAGGLGGTTHVLRHTVAEAKMPLRVELVDWSHGTGRFLADHIHWANIQTHGESLARQVRKLKERAPEQRVYLVGHSAGCAVALVAAEQLPADTIERIVLLAPSVSIDYDLRRSLTTSRHIDCFYSEKDWLVLGVGMFVWGTTDRTWASAAGRVGFRPVGDSERDRELYARLHQHAWEPRKADTGHSGGHYGSDSPDHVRKKILPLFGAPGK